MTKDQYTAFVKLADQVETNLRERDWNHDKEMKFICEEREALEKKFNVEKLRDELQACQKKAEDADERLDAARDKVDEGLNPRRAEWTANKREAFAPFIVAKAEILAASEATDAQKVIARLAAL